MRVPSPAEEAVRDLVRARDAMLADRKRAQQRLTAVLMRHGRIWRGATYWTAAHRAWIAAQRYGEPALAAAVGYYRATLAVREAELASLEAELIPWAAREPLAGPVARLGCYRGIAELGGLTLAVLPVTDLRSRPAHMRVAVTANPATPPRHATLTRPRPPPGQAIPGPRALAAPSSRADGTRRQGRLRRRCASAARPCDPGHPPRDLAAIKATGSAWHAPAPAQRKHPITRKPDKPGTEQAKG